MIDNIEYKGSFSAQDKLVIEALDSGLVQDNTADIVFYDEDEKPHLKYRAELTVIGNIYITTVEKLGKVPSNGQWHKTKTFQRVHNDVTGSIEVTEEQ